MDHDIDKFDEEWYIAKHPDVASAVTNGHWDSGLAHYLEHGRLEGRSTHDSIPISKPRFHLESKNIADNEKREVLSSVRSVLVRRTGMMGDVLMATPVLARLRHVVGPDVRIDFQSATPWALAGNPHIDHSRDTSDPVQKKYEIFINLDGVFERNNGIHTVDAFMLEAFGDFDWYAKNIVLIKRPLPPDIDVNWRCAVALHPALTDRNRTIPAHVWEELMERLEGSGLVPVILGAYREVYLNKTSRAIDLTSKLTLQQTATAVQSSLCLVSADTGLSHVAGSTDTPMVTIYTAVAPKCRMPWRYGHFGWRVISLVPNVDCVGCYSGDGCNRQNFACVEGEEAVSAESLFNAVIELIRFRDHTALLAPYSW